MSAAKRRIKRKIAQLVRMDRTLLLMRNDMANGHQREADFYLRAYIPACYWIFRNRLGGTAITEVMRTRHAEGRTRP